MFSRKIVVMTDYRFTQISIGEHLACGIKPNGVALCWGLGWTQDGRAHQIHAIM